MHSVVSQLCVIFSKCIVWIVIFELWKGKFYTHDYSPDIYRIRLQDKCVLKCTEEAKQNANIM